jgi:hypothetical protein
VQWLGHLLPPVSDLPQGFMLCVHPGKVALWLVIEPCVNFGRVYCVFFLVYIFLFLNFFETPDDG